MREIKFRAWDAKAKKMVTSGVEFVNSSMQFRTAPEVFLMQYTGLKDKNGKDIYEGDVVQGIVAFPQLLTGDTDENSNFKMGGEVFYDHSGFSLRAIQPMCDPKREGMVNYFDFVGGDGEVFEDMEVIGNIYENPDLLAADKRI